MSPFKAVWVDNLFRGGSIIYWTMEESFQPGGSAVFQAQWGRTTNGEFTDISITPVENTFYTYDPEQHLYAKQIDLYYRVRVTTASGTFYSDAARADGGMPARDWRIAREIIRKEYLNLVKNPDGMRGCLHKRRTWGDRCSLCTDYDTAQVDNSRCSVCFGTGIVGGYYPPVDFWVLPMSPPKQRVQRDDSRGMVGDLTEGVRCVAYPFVETGDIWISADDDRRYSVQGAATAVRIRRKALVQQLELRLAPASHIVYDLDLDGCGTGGSADEPASTCEQIESPEDVVADALEEAAESSPSANPFGPLGTIPDY